MGGNGTTDQEDGKTDEGAEDNTEENNSTEEIQGDEQISDEFEPKAEEVISEGDSPKEEL